MNLFWSALALSIIIAFAVAPKAHVVAPNLGFYYGGAGIVREGMATMCRVTTKDYPYNYATHPPTNWAINDAINNYCTAQEYNKTIKSNNELLAEMGDVPVPAFNSCAYRANSNPAIPDVNLSTL